MFNSGVELSAKKLGIGVMNGFIGGEKNRCATWSQTLFKEGGSLKTCSEEKSDNVQSCENLFKDPSFI